MAPSFADLSHELILEIVDMLLDQTLSNAENNENVYYAQLQAEREVNSTTAESKEDRKHEASTEETVAETPGKQSGRSQPDDGKCSENEAEVTQSGEQAVFNLSRTCATFYTLLCPFLFQKVILRNTQKSGAALQYLCSIAQVKYVKILHFKATAPGEEEDNFHDVEGVFPSEVYSILSNLSQFPNLDKLIVDFNFHLNGDDGYDHWSDVLINMTADSDEETEQDIKEAEEHEGWRALVAKTFKGVSADTSDGIRELVIKDCPIRPNSVLGSERFNKWLKKLDSFRFEIYGADTGAGWTTNTAPRFQRYINNMDHYFFDSLTNASCLAIIGHHETPIGHTEHHESLLKLKPEHVPKLKKLELGYYFVQDDLLDFITSHAETLEHLIFNRCYFPAPFYDPYDPEDFEDETGKNWNSFFHQYASKNPRALQRVTFHPYNATMDSEDYEDFEGVAELKDFLLGCRAEGREGRIFPYGEVDDKYGMLFERGEINRMEARRGQDIGGWSELVDVMRINRERLRERGH